MTELAEKIFFQLCRRNNNIYGATAVINASEVAKTYGISKYKAYTVIHELRDEGLVERISIGRPAVVEGYEYPELVCEAMPPLCGWGLTDKGTHSEQYERAWEEYLQGLREWAEGKYDEEN